MQKCINCDYARKAYAGKPYVVCKYWTNGSNTELPKSGLNKAFEGWGYLNQRPDDNDNGNKTIDAQIITNFCIVVDQNDCCYKFTEKKD